MGKEYLIDTNILIGYTGDAIIAATAIVNKLTIITRNIKDFEKIEGLEVINPYNI
jgi:predicted nucleic acid-binding protein